MTPGPEKIRRDVHNQERVLGLVNELHAEGEPMPDIIMAMTLCAAELLMGYAPCTTTAAASQIEAWVAEKASELEEVAATARAQRERG